MRCPNRPVFVLPIFTHTWMTSESRFMAAHRLEGGDHPLFPSLVDELLGSTDNSSY